MKLIFKYNPELTQTLFYSQFNKFVTENGVPEELIFDYRDGAKILLILDLGSKYADDVIETGKGYWFGIPFKFELT